jgi:hypothetical protein
MYFFWYNYQHNLIIYIFTDGEFQYKLINSSRGGVLVLSKGYTYYKAGRAAKIWICTSKYTNLCEAKIKHVNNSFIPVHLDHNHPPPKFHVTKEGKYVKI